MQQYLEILQTCRLFAEIPPDSLKTMLECFAPTIQTYAKQQTLLQAGEPLHQLGIVLTGKVQLVRLDYDGNRSITASLSPAQPFGEASKSPQNVPPEKNCLPISFSRRSRKTAILL